MEVEFENLFKHLPDLMPTSPEDLGELQSCLVNSSNQNQNDRRVKQGLVKFEHLKRIKESQTNS